MRLLPLTALIALSLPVGALAEDAGLVVGIGAYEAVETLRGAKEITRAARGLGRAGIDVQILRDVRRDAIGDALRQLEQQSRRADGLLVALSGQFVHSDQETWFLPIEAEGASLIDTTLSAIPLSSVMALLASTPTRAILLLGTDLDARGVAGPGLRKGIGNLDIPQGVTVIHAEPDVAGDILSDTLARPGASIRARVRDEDEAYVRGFVSPDLSFLPAEGDTSPSTSTSTSDDPDPADQRLWDRMRARDSEDSYTLYLDTYPDGAFVSEATRRLSEIRSDPDRDARRAEDALELDSAARQDIQRDLVLLGFETRGIDGVFGPATRNAIRSWQERNNRPRSGFLTAAIVRDIDEQARRRAALLEEQRRAREADRARAEAAYWAETGEGRTEDGLRRFLERYPDGSLADRANRRLSELRRERGETATRDEDQAWANARDRNTIDSYTAYLREYPRGRYETQAFARIEELRDAGRRGGRDGNRAQAERTENQLGLNQITRRAIEQRLAAEGLNPGKVDGKFDNRTRRAIRAYQQDAQLPATGYLNQITVVRLLADSVRRILR